MTLKDVAAASGCSVATASKVFKNSAEISAETKERVIRVAKELGYLKKATKVDPLLGGLKPVVFFDQDTQYLNKVRELEKLFAKFGFTLIYVACTAKKAVELYEQIGAWGMVAAEELNGVTNSFAFSGDEDDLAIYLKELACYVPKRAVRSNTYSKAKEEQRKAQKPQPKKEEDIWLL